jgi:hypothetical protein
MLVGYKVGGADLRLWHPVLLVAAIALPLRPTWERKKTNVKKKRI